MTDYARIHNFTTKDGLTTGDPAKVIKGSEVDAELDAVVTMSQTKLDEPSFPTAGDVMFYSGSAWVANPGIVMEFVDSQILSAHADLEFFHNAIDAGSNLVDNYSYHYVFTNVVTSTGGASIALQLFELGAYRAAANSYHTDLRLTIAGTESNSSATGTSWRGDCGCLNATTADYQHGLNGMVSVHDPASTTYSTVVEGHMSGISTSFYHGLMRGVLRTSLTNATTKFRIIPSAGTLSSGRVDYYRSRRR